MLAQAGLNKPIHKPQTLHPQGGHELSPEHYIHNCHFYPHIQRILCSLLVNLLYVLLLIPYAFCSTFCIILSLLLKYARSLILQGLLNIWFANITTVCR